MQPSAAYQKHRASLFDVAAIRSERTELPRVKVDVSMLGALPDRWKLNLLMGLLAAGWTEAQTLENHPQPSHETLQAVFAFTSEMMREERIYALSGAA